MVKGYRESEERTNGEPEVVEQTTLALPRGPRRSTVLLSGDQLLSMTRATSQTSDEGDNDNDNLYDNDGNVNNDDAESFVDEESIQPRDIVKDSKKEGRVVERLPTMASMASIAAMTSSTEKLGLPILTVAPSHLRPSMSHGGDSSIDAAAAAAQSQPGALRISGAEITIENETETQDLELQLPLPLPLPVSSVENQTTAGSDEEQEELPPELASLSSRNVTTATVVSQDELEEQIRKQFMSEAVVAQVISSADPEDFSKPMADKSPKRRISKWWFRICFLLIAVAGALALGMLLGSSNDEKSSRSEEQQGFAPSASPFQNQNQGNPQNNATPQNEQLFAGHNESLDEESFDDGLLLLQGILANKSPLVEQVDSPQYKAYQWMYDSEVDDPNDPFFWEYFALATLFFATNGPTSWRQKENWLNSEISPCQWYPGTMCIGTVNSRNDWVAIEESTLAITTLDLSSNGLEGTLPEELSLLTALQVINLDDNPSLTGTFLTSIGSLSSLQLLSARNVGFTGSFPSGLDRLTQLRVLEVQNATGMDGASLPTELWTLPQLEILRLEGLGLTGSLPALTDGALALLQVLDLRYNNLTGSIPSDLSSLWQRSLLELRLEGNDLVGMESVCNTLEENHSRSFDNRNITLDCLEGVECECCTLCCSQGTDCRVPDSD